MTLPSSDLDDELIDDERLSNMAEESEADDDFEEPPEDHPQAPTEEDLAQLATGFGEPRRRQPAPSTPMERTRDHIGRTIEEIAANATPKPGDFPVIERIIGQNPSLYDRTPCSDDYCAAHRNRRRPPAVSKSLIADVRPPIRERLAIAEHEIDDINQILGAHQETLSGAATREDLKALEHANDKQLTNLKNYIRTDILDRVSKLENKSIVKNVLWGIALFITSVYSIIMTYEVLKR